MVPVAAVPAVMVPAVMVMALAGACSGGSNDAQPTTTVQSESAGTAPSAPKPSPEAALDALLTAEMAKDHEASFRLLSAEGRRRHPDSASWASRRNETPPIISFRIEPGGEAEVVASVSHRPALDPFIGLSAAQERQTWTARREGGGWLLDAEPKVELLLPNADRASAAALEWSRAVQACDAERARRRQAVAEPLGASTPPGRLCGATGEVAVGPVENVPPGPASQELVAQYGPDLYQWAKAVRVTAPASPFYVVLAPLGDDWQVIGLFEP